MIRNEPLQNLNFIEGLKTWDKSNRSNKESLKVFISVYYSNARALFEQCLETVRT